MTHIHVTCPDCGFDFKVAGRYAGRNGRCLNPACRAAYRVPAAERAGAAPTHRRRPAAGARPAVGVRQGSSCGATQQSHSANAIPATRPTSKSKPVADQDRPSASAARKPPRLLNRTSSWIYSLAAIVLIGLVVLFLGGPGRRLPPVGESAAAAESTTARGADDRLFKSRVLPFVQKYCTDCHSGDDPTGGVSLDRYAEAAAVSADRKTWDHVLNMLEAGAMPPDDHDPQPGETERRQIVEWIASKLYFVDCDLPPDPGRVTIRRLNRNEYNNTIRDLVGVDFQPADDFPSDDVGEGFDNIGDVLSLPPLLMEKYLDAAEQIVSKAIVTDPDAKDGRRLAGGELKADGGRVDDDGVRLSSTGSAWGEFRFRRNGRYQLLVEAAADQAGPELARMELRVDGEALEVFQVTGHREWNVYETELKGSAGRHRIDAAFINDYYQPKAKNPRDRDRNLAVRMIELRGPLDRRAEDLPETHRRIFITQPDDDTSAPAAAGKILERFASRAFRRPAADAEVERLVELVKATLERGGTFERGVGVAVQAVLVSPHFLFRVESHPQPDDPSARSALSDYELACRLSYFLWSSMPDDELFALASRGELNRPDVLRRQARRMLTAPRSQALVENFGGQWLNLRTLDEVTPDPEQFPQFSAELRRDMERETLLFFEHVLRDDCSIFDFLDGRYTFVNERLALHYGLGGVDGDEFQRVALDGTNRAGLLTQASILSLTSNPGRTSPVKRGKWVLENILDAAPPPPPENVPDLEESAEARPEASLREQLELHRSNAVCASCHRTMDAIGFGFENYDALGRWRDADDGKAIDASGELPGGARFGGPLELVGVLTGRGDEFRRCLARKMLTYALGRGLEYYDKCAIDAIVASLRKNDDRFSTLVTEIVLSPPFRRTRGETPAD